MPNTNFEITCVKPNLTLEQLLHLVAYEYCVLEEMGAKQSRTKVRLLEVKDEGTELVVYKFKVGSRVVRLSTLTIDLKDGCRVFFDIGKNGGNEYRFFDWSDLGLEITKINNKVPYIKFNSNVKGDRWIANKTHYDKSGKMFKLKIETHKDYVVIKKYQMKEEEVEDNVLLDNADVLPIVAAVVSPDKLMNLEEPVYLNDFMCVSGRISALIGFTFNDGTSKSPFTGSVVGKDQNEFKVKIMEREEETSTYYITRDDNREKYRVRNGVELFATKVSKSPHEAAFTIKYHEMTKTFNWKIVDKDVLSNSFKIKIAPE